MSLADTVHEWVSAQMRADAERLEAVLADAIALQDYDRLDSLIVVDQRGYPRTVASLVDP